MKFFKRKSSPASSEPTDQAKTPTVIEPAIKAVPRPVTPPKRWRVILLGLFIFLLFTGSGAGVGFAAGIQQRLAQENEQRLVTAATHFNYGVQAMLSNNYEVARIQFEYVIKIAPDFPEVREKYTQTMVELAKQKLPTPTPQATPTPDNRGVEAIFTQAQQEVNSMNWSAALKTLEALRNQNINYRTLDVDGLYYIALRFSGIDKIHYQADLEGGLYDLTLANRFAPLDREAVKYATWARNYISALSFWNVDWEKVVFYMAQVYLASPGLQDSPGNSATSRHREALWRLGDYKMANELPCEAVQYYQGSLSIRDDPMVQEKYARANLACMAPALTQAALPTPTIEPTVEPTPIP